MGCCTIEGYTRLYNAILPTFPYYAAFTVSPPVVPEQYWNVKSQEERIKWLACNVKKLIDYCDMLAENLNLADDNIEKLYQEFQKFKESGFDDYYADQVAKWISANLDYIYKYTIKQIYFGLDDTGHLVGYVPESWEDITFSTPMTYSDRNTYGRLVLSYEVSTIAGHSTGNERY